jgi:hypothetical protein
METPTLDLLPIEELLANPSSMFELEQQVSLTYWKERYVLLLEKYNNLQKKAVMQESN